MDQNPGKDPLSGNSAVKAKRKKKAKKNGKSNGKTDWKGLSQELSLKVRSLEEKLEETQSHAQEYSELWEEEKEKVEDLQRLVRSLKDELRQMKKAGLGEREKIVLNNLKHFHGQMVNAQLHCDEDKAIIERKCKEVSQFIREQI